MGVAYQRAQVLYQQQRYEQAQKEFERELAEHPEHSSAMAMIAMCLTNQNRLIPARATAEHAIALDPDNDLAHYSLAWAIYKDETYATRRGFHFASNEQTLRGQRLKLVEKALLEALRLQPRNPGYHSLLAFTRLARGNKRGALASANACLEINPHHSDGHRAAALALAQLGKAEKAQYASANAVTAQPLGPEAHLTRAVTLFRYGKIDEALPHFREAVRLNPGSLPTQRGHLECLRAKLLIYRWRARIDRVRLLTSIFYAASFWTLDATIVAHNENAKISNVWSGPSFCYLLAGVVLFSWLCFSRNLADLALLRDPLARRMLSTQRKWTAWIVAACVAGIGIAILAMAALTWVHSDADACVTCGGLLLGIAIVAKFFLARSEKSAARNG